MAYELYTDGACQPNPGKGGWAFILRKQGDNDRIVRSGFEQDTTNNRMELQAVVQGLRCFHEEVQGDSLHLFSDSQYLVKGIMIWSDRWYSQGWIKKDGKPVLNQDLWNEIYRLKQMFELKCTHVRGHQGIPLNEECDQLAVQAIKNG
jgi:ribonuclease HI